MDEGQRRGCCWPPSARRGSSASTPPLHAEWARSQPGLAQRLAGAERSAAEKGWRWVAEMEEIAATFAAAGLPDGFHRAAAAEFSEWS